MGYGMGTLYNSGNWICKICRQFFAVVYRHHMDSHYCTYCKAKLKVITTDSEADKEAAPLRATEVWVQKSDAGKRKDLKGGKNRSFAFLCR